MAKGPSKKRARASRFLVHFFDVYCTTTTWKPLMQRFVEDVPYDDKFSFLYLNMDKALIIIQIQEKSPTFDELSSFK